MSKKEGCSRNALRKILAPLVEFPYLVEYELEVDVECAAIPNASSSEEDHAQVLDQGTPWGPEFPQLNEIAMLDPVGLPEDGQTIRFHVPKEVMQKLVALVGRSITIEEGIVAYECPRCGRRHRVQVRYAPKMVDDIVSAAESATPIDDVSAEGTGDAGA